MPSPETSDADRWLGSFIFLLVSKRDRRGRGVADHFIIHLNPRDLNGKISCYSRCFLPHPLRPIQASQHFILSINQSINTIDSFSKVSLDEDNM